ncbi:MAG TPA: 4Fe-4S binding protein [Methanomicrobia archaeon]|nr:4Fe-4S binding protein [Methanomicrobia archaeon]
MGFLVFVPLFLYQFQMLITGNTNQHGGPLPIVILSLILFFILTLVFGRIFLGFICPIGTLQEPAYQLPTKKPKIVNKTLAVVLHLLFILFSRLVPLGVLFSIGILTFLGVRDFFYLAAGSVFFFVFLAFVLLSIVLYRPFCRFFCPYGLLLPLVAFTSVCKVNYGEPPVARCVANARTFALPRRRAKRS